MAPEYTEEGGVFNHEFTTGMSSVLRLPTSVLPWLGVAFGEDGRPPTSVFLP